MGVDYPNDLFFVTFFTYGARHYPTAIYLPQKSEMIPLKEGMDGTIDSVMMTAEAQLEF
jgi:hypothetical protein